MRSNTENKKTVVDDFCDADFAESEEELEAVADADADVVAEDITENVLAVNEYIDKCMSQIEIGLSSKRQCCIDFRGVKGSASYFPVKVDAYYRHINKNRDSFSNFETIETAVETLLLQEEIARDGLLKMIHSVVSTIDAFRFCSVDLFSTPTLKLKSCCVTKCLQKLSCK